MPAPHANPIEQRRRPREPVPRSRPRDGSRASGEPPRGRTAAPGARAPWSRAGRGDRASGRERAAAPPGCRHLHPPDRAARRNARVGARSREAGGRQRPAAVRTTGGPAIRGAGSAGRDRGAAARTQLDRAGAAERHRGTAHRQPPGGSCRGRAQTRPRADRRTRRPARAGARHAAQAGEPHRPGLVADTNSARRHKRAPSDGKAGQH